MSPSQLRIGIIGAGLYAVMQHVPELRRTGRAEIVAIARRNPDRLAATQQEYGIAEAYTDWREMLDKTSLDAVVVSTPHNLHVEPTVAALAQGLHVLLEKPAADSIAGALHIAQAAKQSGRVVTIGVNTRGMPVWRGVRKAVQSGRIGPLRQISLVSAMDWRFLRQRVNEPDWMQQMRASSTLMNDLWDDWMGTAQWRRDPAQIGGDVFMDVGAHAVDALLWMANSRPVEVVGFKPRNSASSHVVLSAQVRLANDVLISITFNDGVNEGDGDFTAYGTTRTTAIGDHGILTVDSSSYGVQGAKEAWLERGGVRELVGTEGEPVSPAAAFVATVLDGDPNLCTADEGAQTVALIQSAYRSAAGGRIVNLA